MISKSNFGEFEGKQVNQYILRNRNGLEVRVMDYGATITSVRVPIGSGEELEVVCGFDRFDDYFSDAYMENAPYFGGTVGRYASQIKDARFELNGGLYSLAKNCGENNLHGGNIGFDRRMWSAEIRETGGVERLSMKLTSLHLDEGFPGEVMVEVVFSLTDTNRLVIDYNARSDRDTPLSMTNHSYFNLSGFKSSIEGHSVKIASKSKQIWDHSGAGTADFVSLEGQVDDLSEGKFIGDVHEEMGDGFEHYYRLLGTGGLKEVATLSCSASGVSMKVSTTEKGMLFYTGKYTSDQLARDSQRRYGRYRAACFETHRLPNGPNLGDEDSILRSGDKFASTTAFTFDWKIGQDLE